MKSFFKLSQGANLALHALKILKDNGQGNINIQTLAIKLNCSADHLSKVMQNLAKNGVVVAVRGPLGGFSLLNLNISLGEIITMIDGHYSDKHCILERENCLFGKCLFGNKLQKIEEEILSFLNKTKLADL